MLAIIYLQSIFIWIEEFFYNFNWYIMIIFRLKKLYHSVFIFNHVDKHNEPKMAALDTKTCHDKLSHLSTKKDTFL